MEGMTTDDKLLAQDDIDALLGEAGLEGGYDSDSEITGPPRGSVDKSLIRYTNVTDDEAHETMSLLLAKALLERDDEVKVIWNAVGTIPMATGFSMHIQDDEFESLGVLKENHLVVKQKVIE